MDVREKLDLQQLWDKARAAGNAAAVEANAKLPPEQSRGLDCGFAWIVIEPATQPMARYLKGLDIASKYTRGYIVWYSKLHDVPTQSISVHQAAAQAAADVLQRGGVKCYTGSRLD